MARKYAKATTKKLPETKRIGQVIERLELFQTALANDLELRELDEEQRIRLFAQHDAFGTARMLLEQVRSRGELWKGGYLDNVGVVYTDQVQDYVQTQEAIKTDIQLDTELVAQINARS